MDKPVAADLSAVPIDGFDPLDLEASASTMWKDVLEKKAKSDIRNILLSYNGTFDCFSELLQNALDAVLKRHRSEANAYSPKIWIRIDIANSQITVTDNGCGMTKSEFLLLPTPNVSGKKRQEYRGHKGVGATFLTYGFTNIRIDSKSSHGEFAASISSGRRWAEDNSGNVERPRFKEHPFSANELFAEPSGTRVILDIGPSPNERPNLNWLTTDNAHDWLALLRIKTPIGQIYLGTPAFYPHVYLEVISAQHQITRIEEGKPEYPFPHDFTDVFPKAIDLSELKSEISRHIPEHRRKKKDALLEVAPRFRKLDLIWGIWGEEEVREATAAGRIGYQLSARDLELVSRHNVMVYGAFVRSSTKWDEIRKKYKVHGNVRLLSGGLQIASDFMPQGEPLTIPLTSAAGYQDFAHIIVHFTNGDPDYGRKSFQPELTSLAQSLARNAVTEFRDYYAFLGTNTSVKTTTSSADLYRWKKHQEAYADKHPTKVGSIQGRPLAYVSEPQEEQDVIALFHQLIGARVLRGYRFFSTEGKDQYDSLFKFVTSHDEDAFFRSDNNLGVSKQIYREDYETEPKVLEFKYDFKGLVDDVTRDIKRYEDISVLVCWDLIAQPEVWKFC